MCTVTMAFTGQSGNLHIMAGIFSMYNLYLAVHADNYMGGNSQLKWGFHETKKINKIYHRRIQISRQVYILVSTDEWILVPFWPPTKPLIL